MTEIVSSGRPTTPYWVKQKDQRDVAQRPPVVGSSFVPREGYDLLSRADEILDIDAARWWGVAQSWQSKFGLKGNYQDQEESRVRCLITQKSPPICLFEWNSISTFNMLDVLISQDMSYMHETVVNWIHQRSKEGHHPPLGYVQQGVGPHLCPGGNHHPVTPQGCTYAQMNAMITSHWNVRFREHALPGLVVFTGAAVGGGVAISVNSTMRVAASNASMAFGNLSRGASPLMHLSKNLCNELGMSGAASIFLTDTTVSAYAALKGGLISEIAPNIQAAKALGARKLQALVNQPTVRQAVNVMGGYFDWARMSKEATQFEHNSRIGSMFAQLISKGATSAETMDTSTLIAPKKPRAQTTVVHSGGRDSSWGTQGAPEKRKEDEEEEERRKKEETQRPPRSAPQPFAQQIGMQPIPVSACDSPCAQCGTKGTDGTIYGNSYYCETCWVRSGLKAQTAAAPQAQWPERAKHSCSTCAARTNIGQWGYGEYSSYFYCGQCWGMWRGRRKEDGWAGAWTEGSTDYPDDYSGSTGSGGEIWG